MIRKIKKIVNGKATQDGAGVKLVRVLSRGDVSEFDPFLMLDSFDSKNPEDYTKGFPWHPHRGIETVTYLIHGEIEHGDSLGNAGKILSGGCQWMTAGGGILHQEMPQVSEQMLGIQLWLNLPSADKMTAPTYRDITKADVPVLKKDFGEIAIISGMYDSINGPVAGDFVKMTFYDIDLKPSSFIDLTVEPSETVFAFIVKGSVCFETAPGDFVTEKSAVLLENGNQVHLKSSHEGARVLFFSGKPLKEPIAWGGPIVMNTEEELRKAFEDLEKATFVSHDVIMR
ncbi:pirin family protein [Fusibacter tunisiensis]|uniref:Redox-sensitive bicupin YhaK (Pirin superfamily) n=1 Tax=Fusibacter tunisiensis TaxID=1008308 RepID=A0ABS2MN23_9FIRM|nr:pirin family protein [Fusibacter tunisiensis]MBM7560805.1 redox-sensitive bicupin YhaK (pirin superfamily) [Fusibacter tunisiensis]